MITIKHTPVFTILTLLIYLAYLTGLSYSQESGKITGKVYKLSQNNTEEAIEEASVTLSSYVSEKPQKLTAYTNDDGNYVIESIPPGMYNLKAEHKGFKFNEKKNVEITASETLNINFLLSEDSYTIEEIDIVAERFRQAQDDMRTSLLNLSPRTTKVIPGAGEDVLRSLQTLPGVTAPHDFSSQLIIRGSGPDQNLIVMDDVEIFNPYRLYGLFSMFNPETLEDINLITGGFPSKYGDRLSAVLDVMNKEGSRNSKFSGLANINIGNANLVFSGRIPIKELDGSWIVSTRRTYYDLILGPFAKNAGLIDESASFPSFQDIQAKVTLGPFKNHKFIGNAIFSKDGVDIIPGDSKEFEDSLTIRDATKNDVVSLAWHYAPSHKFLSRTTLSWYRNSGDADFGGELLDPVFDREIYNPEIRDSLKALGLFLGVGFSSKYFFRKYSVVNNIILMSNKHKFEIGGGVDIMKTDLQFKITIDDRLKSFIQNNPNFNVLQESFFEGKNYWRTNLYAQDRIKISNNLFVQTGVRFDYYDIIKKAYLSPRINLSYALNDLTTLRMGTGLYYQSPGYEKLIDGQVFYDLSLEKAKRLDAERSTHFVLGLERWLSNQWFTKIEAYYKKFDDLIVQEKLTGYRYEFYLKDPSNQNPAYKRNPDNWIRSSTKQPYDSLTTTPINGAEGKAYGIELFIEKKNSQYKNNYSTLWDKLSGWLSFSLSLTNRERDGLITPYRFEQRHSLNIVTNYRILKWLEFGVRFNYSSNFPFTSPLGIKPRVVGDSLAVLPVVNTVQFDFDFGDKNNKFSARKPQYHRLDVRATAYTKFWNIDWAFYVDVINVYNRKNVIEFDYYIDENLKVRQKTVGQFPLLPTLGVNARF